MRPLSLRRCGKISFILFLDLSRRFSYSAIDITTITIEKFSHTVTVPYLPFSYSHFHYSRAKKLQQGPVFTAKDCFIQ